MEGTFIYDEYVEQRYPDDGDEDTFYLGDPDEEYPRD